MSEVLATIKFEVIDHSNLQLAHAICKYYERCNGIKENALIDLEELSEHINAYVKAERKALAVKNE